MRKRNILIAASSALFTCAIASTSLYLSDLTGVTASDKGKSLTSVKRNAKGESTDITSDYITNASFESDKVSNLTYDSGRGAYVATSVTGWTFDNVSNSGFGVSRIMTSSATATDNGFGAPGTPSDGDNMLYVRNAWTSTTSKVYQTVTLPAGSYELTVDYKCISGSSNHSVQLYAGSESTSMTISSSMPSWTTAKLDFDLENETTVNIGVNISFSNASGLSVIIDNFKLYDTGGADATEEYVPTENDVTSYTEGTVTADFVSEADMKKDLLQMLADFTPYMVNNWFSCQYPNSINEECGYFLGENSGGNNEQGVRHNADFSMICAFLVKYAKPAGITLPSGITYDQLESMAMKSLVFAYSTHKANKLKVCSGNNYWGSVSTSDYTWESSLWAMSVAYSAFFQWDNLSTAQKGYLEAMLKAECNYELNRSIPTGYAGDTKAEENGWEADILAATLGLFPNDALASQWFERMREMAVNSYSHPSDVNNTNVIDAWYNNKTVADMYKGQNLYYDYTLQNHSYFHTSYQNVVQQELGEAALALGMFQRGLNGTETWKSNALMHHNQEVQDNVLNWLALADGELAMPNGNDWSMFLYDQITSYSTLACFMRDPNALLLENLAYKHIKARQKTTTDGSWLLRADVGSRRMGVEAHRVMMTYLMHEYASTADLTPTDWNTFRQAHSEARLITCQNIVRAYTDYRFSTFSWSSGLGSYTGYFAANSVDKNKIVVPYRANNTGNLLGWYEVSGKSTNATPVVSGVYQLKGDGYVMNGEINTNGSTLNNRFAIYSTPSNAIIYIDYVTANSSATITAEKGGLLAISTDEFTKLTRTLYYDANNGSGNTKRIHTDGSSFTKFSSSWVNIDNELGVVGKNDKEIGFGDRGQNNSIYTSKLYPMYSNKSRSVSSGDVVDARNLVYYSLTDTTLTKEFAEKLTSLRDMLPTGWNGVIAPDNECPYFIASNFKGETEATLTNVSYNGLAPVFYESTTIADGKSTVTLNANQNTSVAQPLRVFVNGGDITAYLEDDTTVYVKATADTKPVVYIDNITTKVSLNADETIKLYKDKSGKVQYEYVESTTNSSTDCTGYIVNPSFDGNSSTGWNGSPSVNYNCAEKWNTTFNVYQTITGLKEGQYQITCQGFYRSGGYNAAASSRSAGNESLNAYLYGNDNSVALQSIFTEANTLGAVGVKTSAYGYVPNTMEQASVYFNEGLYENTLICEVGSDGVLTLGVKKTTTISDDWAIFDNFTLTYLGKNITLNDGEAYSATSAEQYDNVSYVRTFNNTEWQSLYIPFSLTYEDWADDYDVAIINDVNMYDNDEDGTVDETEIELLMKKSGQTDANTPYFIKSKTTGTKTISAENATLYPAETNQLECSSTSTSFTFTGTYSGVDGQTMYDNHYYAMSGGALCSVANNTVSLSSYRWYLNVETKANALVRNTFNNPSKIRLRVIGEDEANNISSVNVAETADKCFTIDGRQVNDTEDLKPGMYIKNGRKLIIK